MNNTNFRRRTRSRNQNFYNPLENIFNEMMNVPMKRIVNQKDINYSYPAANIEEHEDKYVLYMMLPGLSKKDIDIKMDKNNLIVSNRTIEATDEKETQSKVDFKLKEFNYGKFERKFQVPNNVLTSKIKASLSKGILSITLSKNPDATRTIEVK